MGAMAIKKLAPKIYLVAELLDLEFYNYLQMAKADEIVFSREYSRILLANAATNAGIAHVIYELLDAHSDCNLVTLSIEASFVGKKFRDLSEYFKKHPSHPRSLCIGLLENTDNLKELKERALSEAQKNPEMKNVLKNLSYIKNIECNRPKLNPGKDYLIPPNSMAIVIANKTPPREVSTND